MVIDYLQLLRNIMNSMMWQCLRFFFLIYFFFYIKMIIKFNALTRFNLRKQQKKTVNTRVTTLKEVYHPQKGLQNALKFIFLAILHLSASESIKKIDLYINAFEIWHFEFFVELFFSFVFYTSKVIFFSMRSCNFKNRMSNVVQKLT